MALDQGLMGPLKQAGPQEPMGLLESMGPLELSRWGFRSRAAGSSGASGCPISRANGAPEAIGPFKTRWAPDQGPIRHLWRSWCPSGDHEAVLETLGLLEVAGTLD